jgi:hypothetical protein
MTKLWLTRFTVAVGGLALSLTAGAGIASATPDLGPAVNTTCTYDQLVAALNAEDPTVAAFLNSIRRCRTDCVNSSPGRPVNGGKLPRR